MTAPSHLKKGKEKIFVIIPALDEEDAIGRVIEDIPGELVDEVIVVDNGSTDQTSSVARLHGAVVLHESRKGYGHACLAGLKHVSSYAKHHPVIVVFLDGDHSDHPEEMEKLLRPVMEEGYDLVVGSRLAGGGGRGVIPVHVILANRSIGLVLSLLLGEEVSDLGPFRAVRYDALSSLGMRETSYGWTVEMIIKALKKGLRVCEVQVSYRRRVGRSKISGRPMASIKAMAVILFCMARYLLD